MCFRPTVLGGECFGLQSEACIVTMQAYLLFLSKFLKGCVISAPKTRR